MRPHLFLDSNHELRSGVRLLAYAMALLSAFVVITVLVSLVVPAEIPFSELIRVGVNGAIAAASALVALIFTARLVDKLPPVVYGITFHSGWLTDFVRGAGIASGMLAILMLGAVLVGRVDMHWAGSRTSIQSFGVTLLVLLVAGAFEELLFRGYPLQVLMKGLGRWPAILLMSAVFGWLHRGNPGSSALSTFNTALAGVLLSIAYLKTRSLWLPYGIHVGWNVGLGVVVGFPLSGLGIASLWTTHVEGSTVILGNDYGPEGGLIGTLIFAAGLLVLYRFRMFGISPQVQTAIDANVSKLYVEN